MSTAVISARGHARLLAELDHLWRVERRAVVQAVSEAAALGDRSENAEYIYGKRRLREIDRRIRYLQKRLGDIKVVRVPPTDRNKVYFGAEITLLYQDDREQTVCLVGPDEIDPGQGLISIDSPLARAALGKCLDMEITLLLPSDAGAPRRVQAEIIAIRYPIYLLEANDSLTQSEAL
ncbi:MAG: transcription elongation factor GreB [Halothiobacillus sp. 24-54-40]|jgi:transcription elongation factor GreB|nr:MAG: transcription elongation factor GreB [Halothiobacillus sp. 20-53-49]OYY42530.1 MAG: transcription elongation factor GreB [Halothiobacillus sp. 35-54-62]OYZ87934.1 MAG: transcription elongation factor GreB [Halothiobacillus sp. 24-54-40]OZA81447.1 MAG: transcription elongation factor GreB [Halothiobacillus sp. 39-53-45]HQS02139.1 transcription elongation factor GreB [Halothiobacillus sp.]